MALLGKSTSSTNAVSMLREDHERIKNLFREFEWAQSPSDKQRLLGQILDDLTVHALVEENVFYPAVREDSAEAEQLLDMALEEHHVAKVLMEELRRMKPTDERYEAKVQVLTEIIKHHIKEEEAGVFSRARVGDLDLEEIGRRLLEARQSLREGVKKTKGERKRSRPSTSRGTKQSAGRPKPAVRKKKAAAR